MYPHDLRRGRYYSSDMSQDSGTEDNSDKNAPWVVALPLRVISFYVTGSIFAILMIRSALAWMLQPPYRVLQNQLGKSPNDVLGSRILTHARIKPR